MEHHERNGDMTAVSSHCSRFTRRHDVSVFNMGDYQSCENCTHFSEDNHCIVKAQRQPGGFDTFE